MMWKTCRLDEIGEKFTARIDEKVHRSILGPCIERNTE